jgi:YbbR domain-containing protein
MEAGAAVRLRAPKNLGWKIAALALSALLWIAVSAEPDLVTTRAVPILYRDLAPQFLVTGDVPESVRVEIRGSASQLSAATLADTVARFELGVIDSPGEHTFTIADSNLNLPRGVTFLRAVPSQLRLTIARMAEKDVPVLVRVNGEVANGFRLVSAAATPATLRIAGSERRVNAITSVETDALEIGGLTQSAERRVNAFVADPQVRFESSPIVSVQLTVERTGK